MGCILVLSTEHCRRGPQLDAPESPPPTERPTRPLFSALHDLPRIRERGQLRVLLLQESEGTLPRKGSPKEQEKSLIDDLGRRLGLEIESYPLSSHAELKSYLQNGYGDLIATSVPLGYLEGTELSATLPVATSADLFVAHRNALPPPTTLSDLEDREIHVLKGSPQEAALLALKKKLPELNITSVVSAEGPEDLLFDVGAGSRALTLVDQRLVHAIAPFHPDLLPLFPLGDPIERAWYVRTNNPQLLAAVNALLTEYALSAHTRERFTGDLTALKERGVLRVLTRNNPLTYFLHRGQPMGFDHELIQLAARQLEVRVEMVVTPSRRELIPWLLEGRGDVIAASLTVTEERKKEITFSHPYLFTHELLVQPRSDRPIKTLEELAGKVIHVRASSSYFQTLKKLQKSIPLLIEAAPEHYETARLISLVGSGDIPLTVSDSPIFNTERAFVDNVDGSLVLEQSNEEKKGVSPPHPGEQAIAFGLRPDNPQLRAFFDDFVKKTYRGLEYNLAVRRYFENKKTMVAG